MTEKTYRIRRQGVEYRNILICIFWKHSCIYGPFPSTYYFTRMSLICAIAQCMLPHSAPTEANILVQFRKVFNGKMTIFCLKINLRKLTLEYNLHLSSGIQFSIISINFKFYTTQRSVLNVQDRLWGQTMLRPSLSGKFSWYVKYLLLEIQVAWMRWMIWMRPVVYYRWHCDRSLRPVATWSSIDVNI